MNNSKGLLIVGHGSRSADAIDEFNRVVAYTGTKTTEYLVKGAHMEIAAPSIPDAVHEMVALGVNDITVIPYFLFTGNHIKNDIPEILLGVKKELPGVSFTLGKPIGFEPSMAGLLLERAKGADTVL